MSSTNIKEKYCMNTDTLRVRGYSLVGFNILKVMSFISTFGTQTPVEIESGGTKRLLVCLAIDRTDQPLQPKDSIWKDIVYSQGRLKAPFFQSHQTWIIETFLVIWNKVCGVHFCPVLAIITQTLLEVSHTQQCFVFFTVANLKSIFFLLKNFNILPHLCCLFDFDFYIPLANV